MHRGGDANAGDKKGEILLDLVLLDGGEECVWSEAGQHDQPAALHQTVQLHRAVAVHVRHGHVTQDGAPEPARRLHPFPNLWRNLVPGSARRHNKSSGTQLQCA